MTLAAGVSGVTWGPLRKGSCDSLECCFCGAGCFKLCRVDFHAGMTVVGQWGFVLKWKSRRRILLCWVDGPGGELMHRPTHSCPTIWSHIPVPPEQLWYLEFPGAGGGGIILSVTKISIIYCKAQKPLKETLEVLCDCLSTSKKERLNLVSVTHWYGLGWIYEPTLAADTSQARLKSFILTL